MAHCVVALVHGDLLVTEARPLLGLALLFLESALLSKLPLLLLLGSPELGLNSFLLDALLFGEPYKLD